MMSVKPVVNLVEEQEEYCYPRWTTLPDDITLSIFSFLGASSICQASLVCKSWLRIAFYKLLWKDLFYRHWGINRSVSMAPGKQSWVQEYKRLLYHTPSVESEVLKQHTDQLLHVSFSHNGEMFATSSKDGFIIVWNTCFPTSLKYKADMKPFFWDYTYFSQFNYSDTLLLVSGGSDIVQGTVMTSEIAIFTLDDCFEMKKRVANNLCSVDGRWLNDCYFLSGDQQVGRNGIYSLICLNKVYEGNVPEHEYEQMRLLKFKNINNFAVSSVLFADCLDCLKENTVPDEETQFEIGNDLEHRRTGQKDINTHTVWQKKTSRNGSCKFKNDKDEKKSVQIQSKLLHINPQGIHGHEQACSAFVSQRVDTSNEMKETSEYDIECFKLPGQTSHTDLEPRANDLRKIESNTNTENSGSLVNTCFRDFGYTDDTDVENHQRVKECKKNNSKKRTSDDSSRVSEDNCFRNIDFATKLEQTKTDLQLKDKYLIFQTATKSRFFHQIGLKRLKSLNTVNECGNPLSNATERDHGPDRNEDYYDVIDHLIEMHGNIIGMCLSPDQRYLYVNCRSWPENYEIKDHLNPPQVAQDIDIIVIDLLTLKKEKTMHRGHMGYTGNCDLVDLDVCDDYVASGAEDLHGYLWDRHYGLCLRKYPHDDVVNSIAFNPTDPEVLVTVSDDYTIKIWRSSNRQREIKNTLSKL